MIIVETVRKVSGEVPNATALWTAGRRVSYAEFIGRVDGLADALRSRGIGPGMRVAICLDRSVEMIVGIFAILTCGAAYVPLDWESPRPRLQSIIEDSRPSLLLTRSDEADLARRTGIEYLDPVAWPAEGSFSRVDHDGPAYLAYTSGSSGRPKGVVIGHRSLENYLAWALAELSFSGGGVPLFSSISFDHSVTMLYPPLMKGETLFLLPSIERGRTLAENLLTGRHYSYVKITPSHFGLLDSEERALLGCSTDILMFGGERLPPEFVAHARRDNPALPVMNHYGPTEATVGCCVHRIPKEFSGTTVPIGQPIPGVTVRVCGPDLTVVKDGEPGELLIGGEALAEGYWRQSDLTEKAFLELDDASGTVTRWYRTGDLVRRRECGDLDYLGRNDQQIKVFGYRIELGEVERVLASHPQVREAAVFSVESPAVGLIAAVTVFEQGTTEEELRRYMRSRLPGTMVPARILAMRRFPVTDNGKLDRQRVLEMAAQQVLPPSNSPIEDLLAIRFRQALGVDQIGSEDDFFELGGDSRAAVEISLWVADYFQIHLEIAAFFKYPTVASLARRIRSLARDDGQM